MAIPVVARGGSCTAWLSGFFLEHHGTIFHGKQAEVELMVRVLACLAEGLGIRATARVFELTQTPSCNGWWKPPSNSRPFPPTFSVTCTSRVSGRTETKTYGSAEATLTFQTLPGRKPL